MNLKLSILLKKAFFLTGAIVLGWTARAQQSSGANATTGANSDTTHHHMRRGGGPWGRMGAGKDSLANHDSFRGGPGGEGFRRGPGGPGFRQGGPGFAGGGQGHFGRPGQGGFGRGQAWAAHRPGRSRFGRGHRGGFGSRLAGGIRYTPEQRKQIAAINKEYKQKSDDLFKKDNITLGAYKAGLVALQKEKKAKTEALVTPKQKEELAARRKRMSENAQVMEVARLERLKLRLNLTDDQVSKIKTGQQNLKTQVQAIHTNDNLLPQQKMDQMKDLLAKRNDTYKSVLTPDQYSRFEKMGIDHRRPGGGGFGGPGGGGFGGPGSR